jgi:hypothetical protein
MTPTDEQLAAWGVTREQFEEDRLAVSDLADRCISIGRREKRRSFLIDFCITITGAAILSILVYHLRS